MEQHLEKHGNSDDTLRIYPDGKSYKLRTFRYDDLNISLKNRREAEAIERSLVNRADNIKKCVIEKYTATERLFAFTLNEALDDIKRFCGTTPTTGISKYYEAEVLNRISAPQLQQKYPQIVPQIMTELRNEYMCVSHAAGMFRKIKIGKEEVEYLFNVRPYVGGGKTERHKIFILMQQKLKIKLLTMYPLIRNVFEECVLSMPRVLVNFKRFRTDYPTTILKLRELFSDEMVNCRYFIHTFYKTIVSLVVNDSYDDVAEKDIVRYLKACSGLLSIYLSRLLENSIKNMIDATASEDTIPYLNLLIVFDSNAHLKLDPDPKLLIDLYLEILNVIANVANNLTVLEYYVDHEYDNSYVHLFLTKKFVCDAAKAVEQNIRNKFEPVLQYINCLETEFYNVYGSSSPSEYFLSEDISFDTGCKEIVYFKKYADKLMGNVSNEYYTIGKLQQQDCIDSLKSSVCQVMNSIFERLCNIHMYKNDRICEEFEIVAHKALEVPRTTEQLMETTEYIQWASTESLPVLEDSIVESLKMTADLIGIAELKPEHVKLNTITVNWIEKMQPILNYSTSLSEQKKLEFEDRLQRVTDQVNKKIGEIKPYLCVMDSMDDCNNSSTYLKMLNPFLVNIRHLDKAIEWINREEKAFKFPLSSYSELELLREHITTFYHLVKICFHWRRWHKVWMDGPFEFLDFSVNEKKVDDMVKEVTELQAKYKKEQRKLATENHPIRFKGAVDDPDYGSIPAPLKLCHKLLLQVKEFRPALNLMGIMCCDALLKRHWDEMSEIAGFDVMPDAAATLRKYINMNLQSNIEKFEITCASAIKEKQLKENLENMQAEWSNLKFSTCLYKDTGYIILTQLDDIHAILDDHIMKTLSMRGSIFIKPYEEKIKMWYQNITRLSKTLEMWGTVQSQWLYLLPIFSSKAGMTQMCDENELFQEVSNIHVECMKTISDCPKVLEVASAIEIPEKLLHCATLLDRIKEGVLQYLEMKRLSFPRFFFLSNHEVFEILSQYKNPHFVQPHLKKCFEAIDKLKFDDQLIIHGMYSKEMEYVKFLSVINTVESHESVEKWLIQVEEQMTSSVRDNIENSSSNCKILPREKWIQNWPGQIVQTVNQAFWTSEVHHCFDSKSKNTIKDYAIALKNQLQDTIALVRNQKLNNLTRMTIKALIVIDIHSKNVVEELERLNVLNDKEFKWQAQLRYYLNNNEMLVRMITAEFKYAYEYVGNTDRLVITPLTERCFRTLAIAYHMHLNGALEGPAAAGKTETVKDMTKALAVHCVVFNCSNGLDYRTTGKFFKGLVSSGAWLCLDEFNRIEAEVLSVVAQQIQTILLAVRANLKNFIFEGSEVKLNPRCYICVTMNPDYVGRTELPDNLKVLFRSVAMMIPDYMMISEISLYSYGFLDARNLSVKIVTTCRLCFEQLSSQSHYDYGTRALKSVISACGNNKHHYPDENENVLLLRSLMDVNLPKFVKQDVFLFEEIISDLFPGVALPQNDYTDFIHAVKTSCEERKLQPTDSFINKVIQTYEMMLVRHAFMLIGDPFTGKTSILKVLSDTLGVMNSKGLPQEKVRYQIINPKSITIGQLYGQFDPVSYEWCDGVVGTCFRTFAVDTSPDRGWIIFDGPVDTVWIENINSALDDNKKLCLASGEVMTMTPGMSLIFEVMDVTQASPATVSRCGMIYLDPATLGWIPLVKSWLSQCNPVWMAENCEQIEGLLSWIVPPCLEFIRKHCRVICNPGEMCFAKSMMQIIQALMDDAIATAQKGEDPRNVFIWIQASIITAGVWGLGGCLNACSKEKFDDFYRILWKGQNSDYPYPHNLERADILIPHEGMLIDYYYIFRSKGLWKNWPEMTKSLKVEDCSNIRQVLVPTVETEKYMSIIQMHIKHNFPVLLVAPSGTGKTFCLQDLLTNKLNQEHFETTYINLTVKMTAHRLQQLVLSKLNRKHRGFYSAPKGKTSVIFIDDLNMPAKDTYGTQPPLELLRQYFDHKNWYDLKTNSPIFLNNLLLIAAMGLVGGSRQELCSRFLHHFSIFSLNEIPDESVSKIFTNVLFLGYKNNGFSNDVAIYVNQIVSASLEIYKSSLKNLRPIPAKSHYVFNLRDFARVIFGCALLKKESAEIKYIFPKLWVHEILRIFCDRLTEKLDKDWMYEKLRNCVGEYFKEDFDSVFQPLGKGEDGKTPETVLKDLMFGSCLQSNAKVNGIKYEEVTDVEAFKTLAELCLDQYNLKNKCQMKLVFFRYALEHLSRICRILAMPGGNAMLIGISGNGRQSLVRIASCIADYKLLQPVITKSYGVSSWRNDMKTIMKEAGGHGKDCVLLITEEQIENEDYLEDIDGLLNAGEIPHIYQIEEKQEILELVRLEAQGGDKKLDISALSVYSFFTKRTREKLHIMLCFTPTDSKFKNRLLLYPSLINCCTIDWFEYWPEDALEQVAESWIAEASLPDDIKQSTVRACKQFHFSAQQLSKEFIVETGYNVYITSTSYANFIKSFMFLTGKKQEQLRITRYRYVTGLQKLDFASEQIGEMQKNLKVLKPQLEEMTAKARAYTKQIQEETSEVEVASQLVKEDENVANEQAAAAQLLKAECEADLALAIPILEDAIAALNTLRPTDITLVKSMKNPPDTIKLVMAAVCVIKDIKPDRIADSATGKRTMDYWGPSKRLLGEMNFLQQLKEFDKDHIKPELMLKIRKEFLTHKDFKPHIVAKASSAAEGLCKWIIAMDMYDNVAKEVAPKKVKLQAAEREYAETMAILKEKKETIVALEEKLEKLNVDLTEATDKQKSLRKSVDECISKLGRAQSLIGGLGGERLRWTAIADDLQKQYDCVPGNILISSGIISYMSPFTEVYRNKAVESWHSHIKELNIPSSDIYSFVQILGSELKVQDWCINGLSNDKFSIENAVIINNSMRYCLIIDPHNQANLWIKKFEKKNQIRTTKFACPNYMKILEQSIKDGIPVLIENVEEEVEVSLNPLLLKQFYKQADSSVICLEYNEIAVDPNFKLYLTTSFANPLYSPEVYNKLTVVNFGITNEGLVERLLHIVGARERPDLQKKKENLILEKASKKERLVNVEKSVLKILSECEGNILDNEKAIQNLNDSKDLAESIRSKQIITIESEEKLEEFRLDYQPVAEHSVVLYYSVCDLPNINPMYQYSMSWFINLYTYSIENAAKSRDLAKRVKILKDTFTYNLYSNVCRSLFEKDKLLFSFILCTKLSMHKNELASDEYTFLLTERTNIRNERENPAKLWLNNKQWNLICNVDCLPAFRNFRSSFEQNVQDWKMYFDCDDLDHYDLPAPWNRELNSFNKLIVLKLIRPEKLLLGISNFLEKEMGKDFITPPPFDISISFKESNQLCPLIFVLSPGTDPISKLTNFANEKKIRLATMSLGQGHEILAQTLIKEGQETGAWVCLQNCHLAVSWMPSLEKIWEDMDNKNTHTNFRLWLTSSPSNKFPMSILRNGVKMTDEPPSSFQRNFLRIFTNEPIRNTQFFEGCHHRNEMFRKLIYGLAFFHVVIQERNSFGPLGWNTPYVISDSDFEFAAYQMQMFVNEYDNPFEAITYSVQNCSYGMRITDKWDLRLMTTLLQDFISPRILTDVNYRFISNEIAYGLPRRWDYEDFVAHINNFPPVHSPEVFGIHSNADISRALRSAEILLRSASKVYCGCRGSSHERYDDNLTNFISDILNRLPEKIDLEAVKDKYPISNKNSLNIILLQEIENFNKLLEEMRYSLKQMLNAVEGTTAMTPNLELSCNSLISGRIPEAWRKVSYPSLKTVSDYVNDFLDRSSFLLKWYKDGEPDTFWFSGLFSPQAFLTSVKLNFARQSNISFEDITFDFDVVKEQTKYAAPPFGMYVYGLFTDGARWDTMTSTLEELLPKVLQDVFPLLWIKPILVNDYQIRGRYETPLYRTSERRGHLSTTGHSSNYILPVPLDTHKPPEHWIKRGVALLCQLN